MVQQNYFQICTYFNFQTLQQNRSFRYIFFLFAPIVSFSFLHPANVLIIHWLDWHEKYLGCFTRGDRCAKMKNRSRIVDQVRRCASSRLDAVRIAVALRQEENLVCRLSRNYGDTMYNGGLFYIQDYSLIRDTYISLYSVSDIVITFY